MDTIVAILRAAHCKSTHHFFVIDSLWEVSTPRGIELADLLLANYGDYLKGAKDPDNVFKDFENHVVHVADGYWGGAAKTGKKWLDIVYRLLNSGNWKEAAYAIGVLSHYFTDPFMPLHTAQSPRETAIHRPLEWSVCCSYQEIYQAACSSSSFTSFELPTGDDWLTDAIHRGATLAHPFYEPLLDDYDMNEASRFPKLALGIDSKRILAQLFVSVQTAWGSALDRIANESTIALPNISLTLPTLLAGVQVPSKKIVQAIESASQRQEVESILDEYQRTGKVVRNITAEQRTVQTVRKQTPELRPAAIEMQRIETQAPVLVVESKKVLPAVMSVPSPPDAAAPPVVENLTPAKTEISPTKKTFNEPLPEVDRLIRPASTPAIPSSSPGIPSESETKSERKRLTLGSPIVDAPAIGPKTAARFHAIGCKTIEDFLSRDVQAIANELNTKWINVGLVAQWQDQSRLACQVDRLTASGAGLLVLAGIHSAEELAEQNASELHAHLLSLAQTSEGKRLIREQEPPMLKKVERWIASAESFKSNCAYVG